jgi:hypothetical protein
MCSNTPIKLHTYVLFLVLSRGNFGECSTEYERGEPLCRTFR